MPASRTHTHTHSYTNLHSHWLTPSWVNLRPGTPDCSPPLGASAKLSLKGPPVEQRWRSWKLHRLCSLGEGDAGQGMGQGTGKMLKRGWERGRLFSFTHSHPAAQPAPWAREVWVASRGPLCPRKALKWGADLGNLASLPNTPRCGKWLSEKGLTCQIWGNKTAKARIPLPPQWWNGSVLRYPSGQQRGKGLEPRLPLCTQGQREGA